MTIGETEVANCTANLRDLSRVHEEPVPRAQLVLRLKELLSAASGTPGAATISGAAAGAGGAASGAGAPAARSLPSSVRVEGLDRACGRFCRPHQP